MSECKTVWLLSWEVRNANDFEGTWAFESELLAKEQVKQWLQASDLDDDELHERYAALDEEGLCDGPKDGDWYRVDEVTVFTEVQ